MVEKMGKKVGYIRVSTTEQNTDRQLVGLELDKIFEDKLSGKNNDRPELQELIGYVRDGDIVYVHSLDRLGRNLDGIRRIITQIVKEKKATISFLHEKLTFSVEDNPFAELQLNMLASFADFWLRSQKIAQKEGIAIAKAKGKYKGGQCKLNKEQQQNLITMVIQGTPKTEIARRFKMSVDAVYLYIKRAKLAKEQYYKQSIDRKLLES
jgi:DNA invertase Pin-like site-specific DNA recombinase